jgi:hypothetical protein
MGADFSTLVYSPNFDMWARSAVVTPLVSQPAVGSFTKRGIYNRNRLTVVLEDGSVMVEQETILDILAAEFPILPTQGDQIDIPADGKVPAAGSFSVISAWDNGGGEINLHLRQLV